MSQYANLKANIALNVYENHNNEVTANMVKAAMNAMTDSLGAGYQYLGVATPATAPGTPDQKVFYIAPPGEYPNFGTGISVADGEVAILKYDTAWHKEVTGAATAAQVTELGQKIADLSLGKFYGFFPAAAGLPAGDEPGYAYVGASSPFAIYVFKDGAWSDSGSVYQPSEGNGEDIDTNAQGKLQFADRPNTDGMGYVILRKDKTFSEQVGDSNTIYEIRYDFDLGGASVTIQAGCVLRFNGGSIMNGVLIGEKTSIEWDKKSIIFDDMILSGDFICPYISDLMFNATDGQIIKSINALQSDSVHNTILIANDHNISEWTTFGTSGYSAYAFLIKSNAHVILNGALTVAPNSYRTYNVFRLVDVNNITIEGNGQIIGDADTHIYESGSTSEWGHGIFAQHAHNVIIRGLTIYKCCGDGIDAGGNSSGTEHGDIYGGNKDIIIEQVILDSNRRNNLTIGHVYNFTITDSTLKNAGAINGTNPKANIDIEPNQGGQYIQDVKHVLISNCKLSDSEGTCITIQGSEMHLAEDIRIDNCTLFSSSSENPSRAAIRCGCKDLKITNSKFDLLSVVNDSTTAAPDIDTNLFVDNCVIKGAGVFFGTGISRAITFRNTTIERTNKYVVDYYSAVIQKHSNVSIVDNVQFENCNISIQEDCVATFTKTNKTYVKFVGCRISLPGKQLNVGGASFYDCIIRADNMFWDFISDASAETSYVHNCVLQLSGNSQYNQIYLRRVNPTGDDVLLLSMIGNVFANESGLIFYNGPFAEYQHSIIVKDNLVNLIQDNIMGLVARALGAMTEISNNHRTGGICDYSNRPTLPSGDNYKGTTIFDKTINKPIWFTGDTWVGANGLKTTLRTSGNFVSRPAAEDTPIGYGYFCLNRQTAEGATDGIMIYHKGEGVWVDALGRVIS